MGKGYLFAVLAGALAFLAPLNAAPCVTQTLNYYIANYKNVNACSTGSLIYSNFEFGKLSVAGVITSSDILVTPDNLTSTLSFSGVLTSTLNHTVAQGAAEQYLLSYVIDPPPIVAGDDLSLDPPTGPIYVSRWSCADQPFGPAPGKATLQGKPVSSYSTVFKCKDGSNPYFLQVSPITQLSASIRFASPAAVVYSRMAIDLLPGTIDGLDAIVAQSPTVPEPSTFLMAGLALGGMAVFVRRRR